MSNKNLHKILTNSMLANGQYSIKTGHTNQAGDAAFAASNGSYNKSHTLYM